MIYSDFYSYQNNILYGIPAEERYIFSNKKIYIKKINTYKNLKIFMKYFYRLEKVESLEIIYR